MYEIFILVYLAGVCVHDRIFSLLGLKGDFTNAFDGGPEAEAASVEPLVERLKAGEFDLIAVGRALLADAEWAEKIRHAREKEIHLFTKEDLKTLK